MDISSKYIQVCSHALPLQKEKYLSGFHAGDWCYLGEEYGIAVLGSHLAGIEQRMVDDWRRGELRQDYQFTMAERISPKMNWKTSFTDREIAVSTENGRYRLQRFYNPVWLPRLDQLVEMLLSTNLQLDGFDSPEQGMLAFYMKAKFRMQYSFEDGMYVPIKESDHVAIR